MATKKKKKKTTTKAKVKPLLRCEEQGPTADGRGKLYRGFVGERDMGELTAKNMTTARKRFATIARKQLK